MKIKIYQVNLERDADSVAFMNLDFTAKHQHSLAINSAIYDKVFEGEVECKSLEDVYAMFNLKHPTGYKARSHSVSDVVEVVEADKVEKGFYFCDSIGFKLVNFDSEMAQVSDRFCDANKVDKLTVLLVKPVSTLNWWRSRTTSKPCRNLWVGTLSSICPLRTRWLSSAMTRER